MAKRVTIVIDEDLDKKTQTSSSQTDTTKTILI